MTEHLNLNEKIDRFIQDNQNALFDDLSALVEVNSVRSEPVQDAPFGLGVRRAMDVALEIAGRLGLESKDCDGYLVYADVPGESEKQIAAITHLDVVPAGNGWSCDPFALTQREGYVL